MYNSGDIMTENVLIVEDDGIFAIELQKKLRGWGYEVPKIALSGKEALKRIENCETDLVIMDISLKGDINGISAGKTIENKFKIPIVFYSSNDDPEIINEIKNFKNGDFVSKTSNDEDLRLSLENILKVGDKMEKVANTSESTNKPAINFKDSLEDYYKAHEKIESEFKRLEANFSKVYEESVSREREIEDLKSAEGKYINIITEKDEKLADMGKVQHQLEEKISLYKKKNQKLLKESENLKKSLNSLMTILNGE